jgi:hypothetical protein
MTARREAIEAAVAAYDNANPLTALPRSAARLLIAMFPTGDVCRRSLEDMAAGGFSPRTLPTTLRRLTEAGFLTRQRGSSQVADIYRLHLPPLMRQ